MDLGPSDNTALPPVPAEPTPDPIVSLSASVYLTSLPQNTTSLLQKAATPKNGKVVIRLKAVGSTPQLSKMVFSIAANQPFGVLVSFIRRRLKYEKSQSLHCYVNSSFSPGLDEVIGDLAERFGIEGRLIVDYCHTVAFG